jgi:prophage regulatory protein
MSQAQTILRLPAVRARVGLKTTAIYERIREPGKFRGPPFPRPIKLGSRASGWVAAEVDEWLAQHIAESRREATEQAAA